MSSEITITETKTTAGHHLGEGQTTVTRRTVVKSQWQPLQAERLREFVDALDHVGVPDNTWLESQRDDNGNTAYLIAVRVEQLDEDPS